MQALLLTWLMGLAEEARGAPSSFIELESVCPITAEALQQRVTAALVGERAPELGASITIRETNDGYEVALRTERGDVTQGTKVVTAPSCAEAVEAATAVLALAFGESSRVLAAATPAAQVVAQPPPVSAPVGSSVVEPPADRSARPQQPQANDSLRLALSTGIDAGTLPNSTAYLAAGLSRAFSELELYGALRYGAPRVEEAAGDAESERLRLDFGSLELGACYGGGRQLRVAACAGGELGVVRIAQSRSLADGTVLETDVARPRFSGVLTARLAYRGGRIEPQLELAGVVLAAERRESTPLAGLGPATKTAVGLRAGIGAAVPF